MAASFLAACTGPGLLAGYKYGQDVMVPARPDPASPSPRVGCGHWRLWGGGNGTLSSSWIWLSPFVQNEW